MWKMKCLTSRDISFQSGLPFLAVPRCRIAELRTTGGAGCYKAFACRTKFLRERVLIRKLCDFEGQIGELSRTCASQHIPAVSRCLQASYPREAKFITQQSGRPRY